MRQQSKSRREVEWAVPSFHALPYSRRLLREKTFVNFKVLWLFRESFLKIWAREIIWQHQRVFRKVFPTKTFHQFVKVCPTKVSCYTVYYRDSTLRHVTLHNAQVVIQKSFLIFITILSSHSLTIQLFSNLFMALVSLVLALCSHFQGTYILCVVVRPCSAVFDHFSCKTTSGILHEIMYTACPMQVQTFNACYPIFQSLVCTYVLHTYTPLSCNTLQTSHHNWTIWENEA